KFQDSAPVSETPAAEVPAAPEVAAAPEQPAPPRKHRVKKASAEAPAAAAPVPAPAAVPAAPAPEPVLTTVAKVEVPVEAPAPVAGVPPALPENRAAAEQKIFDDYVACMRAKPKFDCDQARSKALAALDKPAGKVKPQQRPRKQAAAPLAPEAQAA